MMIPIIGMASQFSTVGNRVLAAIRVSRCHRLPKLFANQIEETRVRSSMTTSVPTIDARDNIPTETACCLCTAPVNRSQRSNWPNHRQQRAVRATNEQSLRRLTPTSQSIDCPVRPILDQSDRKPLFTRAPMNGGVNRVTPMCFPFGFAPRVAPVQRMVHWTFQ